MKNKIEKLRDLLGHAIRVLDEQYRIETITEPIVLEAEVCGKRSIILCNPIGHEELRVSVWWGYKLQENPKDASCPKPISRLPKNKILDALVGGWIERKEGLWLQGEREQMLLPHYCANSAQADLERIPIYESNKILRTGKYFI